MVNPLLAALSSAKGLRARGAFGVDLAWRDSKLSEASISNPAGGSAKIRHGARVVDLTLKPGQTVRLNNTLTSPAIPTPTLKPR